MDSQQISYHYHGCRVYLETLERVFTSYEHLGELITQFSATRPCSSITQRSLKEVALGSRVKYNTNDYGDMVSVNCKLVADKGHHCVNCRKLVTSLKRRKKALQNKSNKWNIGDKWKKRGKLQNCKRQMATLKRKAQVLLVVNHIEVNLNAIISIIY